MSDELAQIIADAIEDPDTEAWTFMAEASDGDVTGYGESGGSEDSYTNIPAAVLIQFAKATDRGQQEFVRDVIEEFNERKTAARAESGEYGGGDA